MTDGVPEMSASGKQVRAFTLIGAEDTDSSF
jgi:hypothetical protein